MLRCHTQAERNDTRFPNPPRCRSRYALPRDADGCLVAAYHNLLYVGVIPEALQPCGAGPSCAKADLNLFGFISIPLLLLVAFTTLAVLLKIGRASCRERVCQYV